MSGVYWLKDAKVGDEVMYHADKWRYPPVPVFKIERVTDTRVSVNGGKFTKDGEAFGSPYSRRLSPVPGTDAAKAVDRWYLVQKVKTLCFSQCSNATLEAIIALVEADLTAQKG